jgi:hypothetical protein
MARMFLCRVLGIVYADSRVHNTIMLSRPDCTKYISCPFDSNVYYSQDQHVEMATGAQPFSKTACFKKPLPFEQLSLA